MFKEKLPEYKIQNMGDESIDKYLNKKNDIESLNSIISDFVKNYEILSTIEAYSNKTDLHLDKAISLIKQE